MALYSQNAPSSTSASRITPKPPPEPRFLYDTEADLLSKLRAVARSVYGAADVVLTEAAQEDLTMLQRTGHAHLPVCVAKTHLSFSDDPKGNGLAEGFTLTVRELRASAGAGTNGFMATMSASRVE